MSMDIGNKIKLAKAVKHKPQQSSVRQQQPSVRQQQQSSVRQQQESMKKMKGG